MTSEKQIETDLLSLLSGEHVSFNIGFNDEHACNYMTAQEWHDTTNGYRGGEEEFVSWVSEEERLKAIEANSVWTCQWYPNSPVGFYCIGASSLPALLDALRAHEAQS